MFDGLQNSDMNGAILLFLLRNTIVIRGHVIAGRWPAASFTEVLC